MIESEDKLNSETEKESTDIVNADETQDDEKPQEIGTESEMKDEDLQDERKDEKGGKRKVVMQKVKTFFKKLLGEFDSALFPLDCTCDVCGEELVEDTRYRLCSECIEKLPFVKGHICLNCGVSLKDESDYCNRCQYQKSAFVKNRSPLVYDGEVKKLIYKLKFGRKTYIAQTLGALMADKFIECGMDSEIIVFVPMTDEEVKKRGFNQAELLAYEVGNRLNIAVLPALVKVKDTSQQKQLKGKDRANNLDGAFACAFEQVKGRKILLIDDVFTTGATANECAKTLLKAKAREVCVLTAAVTQIKIPND